MPSLPGANMFSLAQKDAYVALNDPTAGDTEVEAGPATFLLDPTLK
jgi:hypothetical protein